MVGGPDFGDDCCKTQTRLCIQTPFVWGGIVANSLDLLNADNLVKRAGLELAESP
jgi:hypothetical protein